MAAMNEELKVCTLKDDVNRTQHDHAALNSAAGSLDYFDRYSSFSNLICRFFMLGLQSKDGITLSAVDGGGFVWVSVGLLGSFLAVVASLEENENRKKALEATLAKCQELIERCKKLSEELGFSEDISNEALLEELIKSEDVLRKRKSRKIIAGIMGKNPYSPEFEKMLNEYAHHIINETQDADFDEPVDHTPKVTVKQIVSYIANFISNFGTGSGFVYWGAVIFGVPAPFGWVLMLVGVLVGIIVGSIFVAQQVRMDLQHNTLDESIDHMHESLKLREKLLKRFEKIEKTKELEGTLIEAQPAVKEVVKVELDVDNIPSERQHLYEEEVPNTRKHLFRAGAISYNAVLGFVIGFGLVMTFAFVTGGAGLIPAIIIGLAMSGYFVYTGNDRADKAEEEEADKRMMLQQVKVDYESHWLSHESKDFSPEEELGKNVPRLLLDMINAFDKQNIYKTSNQRYQNQNKVLEILETVTKIQLRRNKELSDAFFDELYIYFLENLRNEFPEEDIEQWEEVKNTVMVLKQKVLGKNTPPLNIPKKPETPIEHIVEWCKKTFTRVTVPKGIRRLFTILGAFTLGAAIPFMAISGGIALPVCVGVFMAVVLTAYIIREVMEYQRIQSMKAMDEEIHKYEIIDRTRKLNKSEKKEVQVEALDQSLCESTAEDSQDCDVINNPGYGPGERRGMLKRLQFISNMDPVHKCIEDPEASMEGQAVSAM